MEGSVDETHAKDKSSIDEMPEVSSFDLVLASEVAENHLGAATPEGIHVGLAAVESGRVENGTMHDEVETDHGEMQENFHVDKRETKPDEEMAIEPVDMVEKGRGEMSCVA